MSEPDPVPRTPAHEGRTHAEVRLRSPRRGASTRKGARCNRTGSLAVRQGGDALAEEPLARREGRRSKVKRRDLGRGLVVVGVERRSFLYRALAESGATKIGRA